MSQLQPFVRAFKALSKSYDAQAEQHEKEAEAQNDWEEEAAFLRRLAYGCRSEAAVHACAATDLEQQIARDLARMGAPIDMAKFADNELGDGGFGSSQDRKDDDERTFPTSPDMHFDETGNLVWSRDVKKGETVQIPVEFLGSARP